MEHESAFIIRNPAQIINKLSLLLKNKRLITVYFGDKKDSFVSTLLDVDKKDKILIFDGCKEELAEQLLSSPKIICNTEHLGAKVVFNLTDLVPINYQSKLAFTAPMPEMMRWIEHREFFRLRAPYATPSHCVLTIKDKEPVKLKLYDISLRGFSMLNTSEEISELMIPEAHFEKIKLELEGVGECVVSFEVRNKCVINSDKANSLEKIGCKFTRLAPSIEDTIQRYMLQVEREILKKKEMGTVLF
ncbi:putative glycosyltransferase [Methyloglobulus morosus KoM1]|uniref:Flagellar brake protein YcgR n=1 Tax=Methyloglobulus morosus KoM1 TaxID=1116472 RepID=V5BZS1_9GAMM|nr:flagellar brake protein [Methyloglobulus morosus]ESS73329.1 putative glycosyltransferase [Methyloglobulus morosus KoM1]